MLKKCYHTYIISCIQTLEPEKNRVSGFIPIPELEPENPKKSGSKPEPEPGNPKKSGIYF